MSLLKTRRRRSIAGFTLLEVLIVIIIISVLFAIAAPSWDAVMNRQRVNVVRDQATQLIRQAQADARRTHTARIVVFDPNPTGIPRAAVVPQTLDTATGKTSGFVANPTTTITNWQTLGNGDIKSGALYLKTFPKDQLVFNSNGAIDPLSETAAGNADNINQTKRVFTVNVAQMRNKNELPATRRCVIVTTLLGAVRQAEGDNCPTS